MNPAHRRSWTISSLKLRMARHLRTPEYNELFGGDPMWITESLGGTGEDGRTLVTKNSYRMLHTLYNLHPPRSRTSPCCGRSTCRKNWKRFVAKVSCDTDAIQYENDDRYAPRITVMITPLPAASPPCGSARICSSSVRAPTLQSSYCSPSTAVVDEAEKRPACAPEMACLAGRIRGFRRASSTASISTAIGSAKTYVDAMNTIHYMHDKYAYEKSQMALHDTECPPSDGLWHRRHELHGRLPFRH